MDNVIDDLSQFVQQEEEKRRIELQERDREYERRERESLRSLEIANSLCSQANARASYIKWLYRYIKSGGTATHKYDYPMRYDWRIATTNISPTFKLYGSRAFNLVVPEEYSAKDGEYGHIHIYAYECGLPVVKGSHWVPVYSDTLEMIEKL